jgi:hypothetical protein
MHLDAGAVLARQLDAARDQPLGAVHRDGRRHRGRDAASVPSPVAHHLLDGGERLLDRRHPECADLGPQVGGQCIEQARDRLVEAAVGDHRADDRTDARVVVRLRDRLQALDRRHRMFVHQVVAGGDALGQHLDRAGQRREVFLFRVALAGRPGAVDQRDLECPAVAHSLHQIAVPVGVGIDETGDDQSVGRIEAFGGFGDGRLRRLDRDDAPAVHQHGARAVGTGVGIEDSAVDECEHGEGLVVRSDVSHRVGSNLQHEIEPAQCRHCRCKRSTIRSGPGVCRRGAARCTTCDGRSTGLCSGGASRASLEDLPHQRVTPPRASCFRSVRDAPPGCLPRARKKFLRQCRARCALRGNRAA